LNGRLRPVIAIGLDAFEVELLERWCAAGDLPNLTALRQRGRVFALDGEWPGVAIQPWYSFVSDLPIGEHGRFYRKGWSGRRGQVWKDPGWVGARQPFWAELVDDGARVATVDVPGAPDLLRNPAQTIVSGWQNHDEVASGCRPRDLGAALRRGLGSPALGADHYGDISDRTLRQVFDGCLAATRQFGQLVLEVLDRGPHDLVLAVLGAAHRGGHYLWDPRALAGQGRIARSTAEELQDALRAIYRAADEAVGGIIAAVSPETTVLVFGLHGMGAASPWTERLPLLLDFVSGRGVGLAAARPRGWLARLRRSPLALAAGRALPPAVQSAFAGIVWRRLYDWSRTRVFAVPSEGIGAIRVNLAGRDRYGIVRPGREYAAVLDGLTEALTGLRELATGEPLVEAVQRVADVVPSETEAWDHLPDLVVQWRELPCGSCRGVVAPDGRVLDFGGPLYTSSGRTGDHRPRGFAILAGPGVSSAQESAVGSTRALPTLLRDLVRGTGDARLSGASPVARIEAQV
jgi:predicted AlkP superfamily phosphohydrolase/phosphomutase